MKFDIIRTQPDPFAWVKDAPIVMRRSFLVKGRPVYDFSYDVTPLLNPMVTRHFSRHPVI